jgi:hypothetical protein
MAGVLGEELPRSGVAGERVGAGEPELAMGDMDPDEGGCFLPFAVVKGRLDRSGDGITAGERTMVSLPQWSSRAARVHAVVVSVLTPAETLIAARRLAGARPHLAAVAGIVHHEDRWQLWRDELTGVDVRIDGWDIRGRWFGGVVGATPRLGGAATRRDDPRARDRRPARAARTPRLALTRWRPA